MRRMLKVLICLGLLGLNLPAQSETPSHFSFRITGGLNWLDGGDLNAGAEGVFEFYEYLAELTRFSHEGKFSPANLGLNFGGELVFMITPRLGVGLGAGMLSAAKNPAMEWAGGGRSGEMEYRIRASAIPIRLSFHYVFPTSSRMNLFVNAGLGAYPAKAELSIIWKTSGFPADTQEMDASKVGLGFHGGLGLEYALTPMFGIVAEFAGRLASFSGFDAEARNGWTESGTLYYLESSMFPRPFAALDVSG